MANEFKIIRPINLRPKPDKYEERVTEPLATKFQSDIMFVVRGSKLTPLRVESRIKYILKSTKVKINRVLFVTRAGKIIDIK